MYCLDASVITNSVIEAEKHYEYSKRLLLKIKNQNLLVVLPEVVIPEVASALSRGTGNSKLALEFVTELRKIPNFIFISIDSDISNFAAKLAAEKQLRGSDSIYVAVTSLFNVRLITLDIKQMEKSKATVKVLTPLEELGG